MQQWDYKLVSIGIDWEEDTDKPAGIDKGRLIQLGNDGWELVGIAPVNGPLDDGMSCTVEIQYVFKRPKASTPQAKQAPTQGQKKQGAPLSAEAAARIQRAGAQKPESKTAQSGFPSRAQRTAAKQAAHPGKRS